MNNQEKFNPESLNLENPTQEKSEQEKKRLNKIIPLYFVAFFIILAILDGIFVYLALDSHNGVTTKNAYEKGLEYNQSITQAEIAKDIKQELAYKIISDNLVKVSYSADIKINVPKITIKLIRPIEQGKDFFSQLHLNESNDKYEAKIKFPLKGNWDILLKTNAAEIELRKKLRIFIP